MALHYRLTVKGKKLLWLLRELNGEELTPKQFIAKLDSDKAKVNGTCLSCGDEDRVLAVGAFCTSCVRGAITTRR